MNTNEGQALFSRIQENIFDLAPQLIFSDWLEEQERLNEALLWRGTKPTELDLYELYRDGYGSGSDDGSGNDYGYGFGNGFGNDYGYGYGNGDGNGDGNGNGYGYGYGNGDGYGYGYGYGNGDGYGYGYGNGYGFEYIQDRDAWLKQNINLTNS